MDMGVHKIDAPISGPRIADKNFTDTRIFLNFRARIENEESKPIFYLNSVLALCHVVKCDSRRLF